MYHLKTLAKSPVLKHELAKVLPVAASLTQTRNYADHQIPDRLRDVPTAKGMQMQHRKSALYNTYTCRHFRCGHFIFGH